MTFRQITEEKVLGKRCGVTRTVETRQWYEDRDEGFVVVYYESRKREVKIRLMNEGRCDERLHRLLFIMNR